MEETYAYGMWPYEKLGIYPTAIKIDETYLSESYKEWYQDLFGDNRVALDLDIKKDHIKGLLNFKKYLKRLYQKEDLRYCSKDDALDSYKKIEEQIEHTKHLVKSFDKAIRKNYDIITSKKYAVIYDKYRDVATALFNLAYPDFVRKILHL